MNNFLPSIAEHAKTHGLTPQKKLGQNFIFDSNFCDKIVSHSEIFTKYQNLNILEIGPGPAGLTRSILQNKPLKLITIETDSRCIKLLNEISLLYPELEIIIGDALKININNIFEKFTNQKFHVISNIPYNISSQLIYQWIENIEYLSSITIMIQKELADRICSKHNTKEYGKLSVICQNFFDIKKLFDVPPHIFYPAPKVWSSVIQLIPKNNVISKTEYIKLKDVLSFAFNMRRKKIKTSLKPFLNQIEKFLENEKLSTDLRPENLSTKNYLDLVRFLL